MSLIGWIFVILAVITVAGGLYKVYITAYKMPIGKEKMKRIKARQAEMEAQEAREKEQD
ncbi:DUF2897 family protein [Halopseudomonas pelagia]|uniref:DUF2897 family protein n=1 Tax=Halopseudomonas pelagia TaxID=553151 RepID=UPI0003A261C0|nr:DUF2897 family protein [Halopseudomonas pelagia]|tara:strand:- start:1575 stop:1751 length:177 start_codon:yes stop_codon:yes gene_type:complete